MYSTIFLMNFGTFSGREVQVVIHNGRVSFKRKIKSSFSWADIEIPILLKHLQNISTPFLNTFYLFEWSNFHS